MDDWGVLGLRSFGGVNWSVWQASGRCFLFAGGERSRETCLKDIHSRADLTATSCRAEVKLGERSRAALLIIIILVDVRNMVIFVIGAIVFTMVITGVH